MLVNLANLESSFSTLLKVSHWLGCSIIMLCSKSTCSFTSRSQLNQIRCHPACDTMGHKHLPGYCFQYLPWLLHTTILYAVDRSSLADLFLLNDMTTSWREQHNLVSQKQWVCNSSPSNSFISFSIQLFRTSLHTIILELILCHLLFLICWLFTFLLFPYNSASWWSTGLHWLRRLCLEVFVLDNTILWGIYGTYIYCNHIVQPLLSCMVPRIFHNTWNWLDTMLALLSLTIFMFTLLVNALRIFSSAMSYNFRSQVLRWFFNVVGFLPMSTILYQ